jgi:hypothetical protein
MSDSRPAFTNTSCDNSMMTSVAIWRSSLACRARKDRPQKLTPPMLFARYQADPTLCDLKRKDRAARSPRTAHSARGMGGRFARPKAPRGPSLYDVGTGRSSAPPFHHCGSVRGGWQRHATHVSVLSRSQGR